MGPAVRRLSGLGRRALAQYRVALRLARARGGDTGEVRPPAHPPSPPVAPPLPLAPPPVPQRRLDGAALGWPGAGGIRGMESS